MHDSRQAFDTRDTKVKLLATRRYCIKRFSLLGSRPVVARLCIAMIGCLPVHCSYSTTIMWPRMPPDWAMSSISNLRKPRRLWMLSSE